MKIEVVPTGPLSSNMYILEDEGSFFIIDPSVDPDRVDIPYESVKGILITHGHFDHIYYLDKWVSKTSSPVYMGREDMRCLEDADYNLSCDFGMNMTYLATASDIFELENYSGKVSFKILSTPGHSEGSVCIIVSEGGQKAMFSGDMLFRDSIGRTDFTGSNHRKMLESIRLLASLGSEYDNMDVFSGHGPSTTLLREKKFNPYFN